MSSCFADILQMLPHRRQLFAIVLGLSAVPFLLGQTQAEMNRSAAHDYETADRELNVTYKKLLKKLDKESAVKLKAAQTAWIAFRDTDAAFAGDAARGGTLEPCLVSGRAMMLTQGRTKDLQADLQIRSR